MKTVVIIADFGYVEGGAAKVALDSVRLLHQAGMRVILFCGSKMVESEVERLGVRIVRLGQYELKENPNRLVAMRDGLWNGRAAAELGKLLDSLDPAETVVHIHTWTKILSPSIFSVLRKSGFRTVLTVHDYFLGCPNGAIYDYRKGRPCPCRGGSIRCLFCNCDARKYVHKLWRWVRQQVIGYQLRRFDRLELITISDLEQRHLQDQIGTRNRCLRINNPVRFSAAEDAVSSARDAFVFVGRVSPEKDPLTFAEAIARCGGKGIMIGDGPLLGEVRRRYPQIECLGWKGAEEVSHILSTRAIALAFTSVWFEGAPLSPLEAMSVGVPCIISDRTNASEYIVDGETGLLYRTGDVDDLSAKMRRLSDVQERARIAENVRRRFDRDAYSEETYVCRLSQLYGEDGVVQ